MSCLLGSFFSLFSGFSWVPILMIILQTFGVTFWALLLLLVSLWFKMQASVVYRKVRVVVPQGESSVSWELRVENCV